MEQSQSIKWPIITEFSIGDRVRIIDPDIKGYIMGIVIRLSAVLYDVGYWIDNENINYTAYPWEIELIYPEVN